MYDALARTDKVWSGGPGECPVVQSIKLAADMPARDIQVYRHTAAQMQPVLQALSDAWIVLQTRQVTLILIDRDAEITLAIASQRTCVRGLGDHCTQVRPCRSALLLSQHRHIFSVDLLEIQEVNTPDGLCVVRTVPLFGMSRTDGIRSIRRDDDKSSPARVGITSSDLQR